jgi:hypothetical protein
MTQGAIGKADQTAAGVNSQLQSAESRYKQAATASVPAYTPTAAPPVVNGGGGLVGGGRTTTQLNTAPNLAAAQDAVNATYQGPHSLAETPGVNIGTLQQGLDNAQQQYAALGTNPSNQAGGIGRFNDFLIGAEGGGAINAAQQRFQGLRDRFNAGVADNSPAAAGQAAIANNAKAGQKVLDQSAADTASAAAAATKAKQAADADAAAKSDDAAAYADWKKVNGVAGDASGVNSQAYFDAHKDEIKKKLQDPIVQRFYGATYGIDPAHMFAAAGLNPDGTKKLG